MVLEILTGCIWNGNRLLFFIFLKIKIKKSNQLQVGRGNLVFRHSITHFPLNSGGIAFWMAEVNAALCLNTSRIHNQSRLLSYFVLLIYIQDYIINLNESKMRLDSFQRGAGSNLAKFLYVFSISIFIS